MPEITHLEYDLLMEAIRANATSTASLTETVTNLRERYAERFLTKDEDAQHDKELLAPIKDDVAALRKLIYFLSGAAITLSAAALGGHLSHIPGP